MIETFVQTFQTPVHAIREGSMPFSNFRKFQSIFAVLTILVLVCGCSMEDKFAGLQPAVADLGDINDNGIPNEIADAVMFTNYFISGDAAFADHVEASRLNSDANRNGIYLELGDMVYIVRIITGDANPHIKPLPETPVLITLKNGAVDFQSPMNLGAFFLKFDITGEIGTPALGDGTSGMDIKYLINDHELRVLIYNIGFEYITAGEHTAVVIPYTGNISLIDAEAATYDGFNVDVNIEGTPLQYGLSQNYPNPFSSSTTIALSLPIAAEWQLVIKDAEGEFVREYSGFSDAGVVKITWDATDSNGNAVQPGVYFYTVTIGDYSATKSMVYSP